MSKAIDNLTKAMEQAAAIRPKVGGFPYLARACDALESSATSGLSPRAKVSS
jgi:hypothetical protein